MSAVEVRDLFRVYSTPEGHAAALQGLTLSVQEKEVLVVLGPSGSGKSTLLRVLAGLERPSAGTAHVFDADLGRLSSSRLAEYRSRTTGYVEQHYSRSLDPDLTARELVGVQLGLAGAPGAEREKRADELLERVGLADKRAARPAELSGGEQQRIAVCAALAHRPKLLLADEPTGELDAASAGLVYELIGELAREHGCTTVLVSHDVESTAIADRTVRVRDGRVSEETERGDGETLVVARGGWVRLPEELLVRARIGSRARAELGDEGIVVSAAGEPAQPGSRDGQAPAPALEENGALLAQARGVGKRYGAGARETVVLDGLDADFRRRPADCADRPLRLGEDDAPPHPRRAARPERRERQRPRQRPGRAWAGGARRAPARPDRVHPAGSGTDPVSQRARERGGRARATAT